MHKLLPAVLLLPFLVGCQEIPGEPTTTEPVATFSTNSSGWHPINGFQIDCFEAILVDGHYRAQCEDKPNGYRQCQIQLRGKGLGENTGYVYRVNETLNSKLLTGQRYVMNRRFNVIGLKQAPTIRVWEKIRMTWVNGELQVEIEERDSEGGFCDYA